MAYTPPQRRQNVREIQIARRQIPVEQIIQTEGFNPLAAGIETAGNEIGKTLQRRLELQRQGQELARLEKIGGFGQGELQGVDPQIASAITLSKIKDKSDESDKNFDRALKLKKLELDESYRDKLLKLKGGSAGGKPLTGPMADQISKGDTALKELNNASLQYDESFTGPFEGRLSSLESVPFAKNIPFLGKKIVNPDRAKFNQNLEFGIVKFLYSEAGKQLSDEERQYVRSVINEPSKDDAVFKSRLDNAIRIMGDANLRYKNLLSQTGYKVPGINASNNDPLLDELLKQGLVSE